MIDFKEVAQAVKKGGPGSGHHGHGGRPGELGGSTPGKGTVGARSGKTLPSVGKPKPKATKSYSQMKNEVIEGAARAATSASIAGFGNRFKSEIGAQAHLRHEAQRSKFNRAREAYLDVALQNNSYYDPYWEDQYRKTEGSPETPAQEQKYQEEKIRAIGTGEYQDVAWENALKRTYDRGELKTITGKPVTIPTTGETVKAVKGEYKLALGEALKAGIVRASVAAAASVVNYFWNKVRQSNVAVAPLKLSIDEDRAESLLRTVYAKAVGDKEKRIDTIITGAKGRYQKKLEEEGKVLTEADKNKYQLTPEERNEIFYLGKEIENRSRQEAAKLVREESKNKLETAFGPPKTKPKKIAPLKDIAPVKSKKVKTVSAKKVKVVKPKSTKPKQAPVKEIPGKVQQYRSLKNKKAQRNITSAENLQLIRLMADKEVKPYLGKNESVQDVYKLYADTIDDLYKEFSSTPVQGALLVREDLHGGRRRKKKRKKSKGET